MSGQWRDNASDLAVAEAVVGRAPGSSGWIRYNCPLCELVTGKEDRKCSAGLNAVSLRYNCFKCGAGGRLKQAPEDYDIDEVLAEEGVEYIDPPDGFTPLMSPEGRKAMAFYPAWDYVVDARGLTEELVEEAHIGACLDGDMAGRVVVPVLDLDGGWQWYVGRAWTKKHWKPYLYPAGSRHDVLYNQRALLVETETPVLVVEGVFDALHGWPDAVATLGKTTDGLLDALTKSKRPVVFAPDGDEWASGLACCLRLRQRGIISGALRLPPRVDPDEVDVDELRAMAVESLG